MAVRFSNTAAQRLVRTTDLLCSNRATQTYTIMAWVRITTLPTGGNIDTIFSLNGNDIGGSGFYDMLQFPSTGVLGINVSGETLVTGSTLSVNTWAHLALQRAGSQTVNLLVNGVTVAQTLQSEPASSSTLTRNEIGGATTGNLNIFNGRVARIKAWQAALSVDEIALEMLAIRPVRTANLYGFWPTWIGTGRNLDYSGNGRNWTVGGTLTDEDDPPIGYGAEPYTMIELVGTPPPTDKPTSDSFSFTESASVITLLDGLVAYWPMEEAADTTRADAHAAVSGSAQDLNVANTVSQTTGKVGNAAQFTRASSESLQRADSAELSHGDIDFTYTAWIYLDSHHGASQSNRIVNKNRTPLDSSDDWEIAWGVAGDTQQLSLHVGNGDGTHFLSFQDDGFGALATGTWYFVSAWHDSVANTLNLQVNNGTVRTESYSFGSFDGNGAFIVGGGAFVNDYFSGRIDELGRWNRVLTATERTALYNAGDGLAYPFLPAADRPTTDSATLSETAAVAVSLELTDTATLAEGTPAVALTATDSAALADAATVAQTNAVTASDALVLTDVATPSASSSASDSSSTLDVAATAAALALTDAANLTDAATVAQGSAVTASDAGAVTDSAALAAALAAVDPQTATEAAALAAALAGSEALALAAETAEVPEAGGADLAASDALALAEVASPSAALAAADVLALTDAQAVAVALAQADALALAAEVADVPEAGTAARSGSDALTLAEAATLAAAPGATDAILLAESAGLVAALAPTDTATLADTATVALPNAVSAADALALIESASPVAATIATESATLAEAASVAQTAAVVAADAWALAEGAALLAALLPGDTLTLTESVSIGGDFVPITGLTPMHAELVTAGATDADLLTAGRTGAAFVTDGVTTQELVGV